MSELWKRLCNTGSVMAIVGFGVIIAQNLGLVFDVGVVNSTVEAVCGILVILGVLNNSTTRGVDNPFKKE